MASRSNQERSLTIRITLTRQRSGKLREVVSSLIQNSELKVIPMRFLDIGVILILSVAVGSCAKPQSTEAPGAVCSLPETSVLPAALTAQETNLWCWAASGEMIMDFHQHGVSQCLQANNELNRPDCCSLIKPDLCIQGGWPEFDKYNFTFKRTTDKELTWDQ